MALSTSYRTAAASVVPNENAKAQEVNEGSEKVEAEASQSPQDLEASESPPSETNEQEEYVYENDPGESIEQEIANAFGEEFRLAMAVAMAESGLNPKAVNYNRDGSRDIGIFQINERHGWSEEDLFDWEKNIAIAKHLRDVSGWSTWTAYSNGTYRKYL